MRIHWIFQCICNYYVHKVVRSYGLVDGWKVAEKKSKNGDFTTPTSLKCCSICHNTRFPRNFTPRSGLLTHRILRHYLLPVGSYRRSKNGRKWPLRRLQLRITKWRQTEQTFVTRDRLGSREWVFNWYKSQPTNSPNPRKLGISKAPPLPICSIYYQAGGAALWIVGCWKVTKLQQNIQHLCLPAKKIVQYIGGLSLTMCGLFLFSHLVLSFPTWRWGLPSIRSCFFLCSS